MFPSINEASVAYGVDRKYLWKRIQDGLPLRDGYTTVDFLYDGMEDEPTQSPQESFVEAVAV